MQLTIITGLSGAGRSSALRTLEDMGFFCSDNIPPALIPSFARLCMERPSASENVALVADMRMGDMFDSIYDAIDELGKMAGEEILRRIKDRAAEQKQILLSSIYLGVLSRHSQ